MATMTLADALAKLEALGHEKVRAQEGRRDAGDNQFGVKLGDIRKLAKQVENSHDLAFELWETGNLDARLLAVLLFEPKRLSSTELERLVRSGDVAQVADWLNAYVVRKHPDREALRRSWMASSDPWEARAGWSMTSERVGRSPEGIDIAPLLDRIESEMASAAPVVQWTMNFTLAGIGIHVPEHRERAIAIGESLGIYRDYPVPRGCTSPFAPVWIREMANRQAGAAAQS